MKVDVPPHWPNQYWYAPNSLPLHTHNCTPLFWNSCAQQCFHSHVPLSKKPHIPILKHTYLHCPSVMVLTSDHYLTLQRDCCYSPNCLPKWSKPSGEHQNKASNQKGWKNVGYSSKITLCKRNLSVINSYNFMLSNLVSNGCIISMLRTVYWGTF
jgi:hypothetical protein